MTTYGAVRLLLSALVNFIMNSRAPGHIAPIKIVTTRPTTMIATEIAAMSIVPFIRSIVRSTLQDSQDLRAALTDPVFERSLRICSWVRAGLSRAATHTDRTV